MRKNYVDYLRALSAILVVMIHTGVLWASMEVQSFDWTVGVVYDSIARVSVPLFFMISGALFLRKGKEVSVRYVWKK